MITLDPQLETELAYLAAEKGVSISELIQKLIINQQDVQDARDAEQALKESGSLSLAELKSKYAL